jgi:hypothetical protein
LEHALTIRAKTHPGLPLNTVLLENTVSKAEFFGLVEFYKQASSQAAKIDSVYVFERGVVLQGIDREALVEFKRALVDALASVQRQIYIRTAHVCREPGCLPLLEAWATMSRPDDGLFSQPRVVADLAEAGAWLALSDAEMAAVVAFFSTPG